MDPSPKKRWLYHIGFMLRWCVNKKIKLGVIGNGGRGAWIAKLFQAHGGYDLWAVADYFPEVAHRCGEELGVDRSRRFSI